MLLKDIPKYERPREKALYHGIKSLSNSELIAIIFRTGTHSRSAIDTANELLYYLNSINDLNEITLQELIQIKGIGTTKALTLLATIELGQRINTPNIQGQKIDSALKVYNYYFNIMNKYKEEHLYAMYLDCKSILISDKLISIGNINSTIIDPAIIFKWAHKLSSSAIIIVHNHPSSKY